MRGATAMAAIPIEKQVARAIAERREEIACALVAAEFAQHPELVRRYGPQGRERSRADACCHLAYLAQAVGAGEPDLFSDYVHWTRALLESRGVLACDLAFHLERMGEALEQALPREEAALARAYLTRGLAAIGDQPVYPPSFMKPGAPLFDLAQAYLDALLAGERHRASRAILAAAEGGTPVRDLYLHVFQPVQREVGRLWQINAIGVAEEHYCSAATQLIMSQLYPLIFSQDKRGRTMVATCVEGELHEIGIRMLADIFEMDGWNTYYLGANTPDAGVLQTLVERDADLLCISATLTPHLGKVEGLIAAVRSDAGCPAVKIMVGGYPFAVAPDLWRRLGADGCAPDAVTAVAAAERLVTPLEAK